jgi:aerobic carbon-monoxide dehydrogenase medium subunit
LKAPAFDYARPRSLGEAIRLLIDGAGEAQLMAGGQSLVAMLNLRVASPALVIDIARLPELRTHAEDDGAVMLGACITHAAIEDGRVPDPSRGLMPRAAATLAYRAIRNRGTIGGSLALADPAAEWPAVLAALDAEAVVHGPDGERRIGCAGFVTGIYETRLSRGEIVTAIRIPRLGSRARWGYVKFAQKSGEFAASLAAVVLDPDRAYARAVLGAAEGPPIVLRRTSQRLAGTDEELRSAIAADLGDERRGFDDDRRELHAVTVARAARQAAA